MRRSLILLFALFASTVIVAASACLCSAKETVFGPYNYWQRVEEKVIDIHRNWRQHLIETGVREFKESIDLPGAVSTREFIKGFKTNTEEIDKITAAVAALGVDLDAHEGVRVKTATDGALAAQSGKSAILLTVLDCHNDLRPNTYGQNTRKDWQGGHVIKGIHAWGELSCKVQMTVFSPGAEGGAAGGDL